jgi:hypothetical protein
VSHSGSSGGSFKEQWWLISEQWWLIHRAVVAHTGNSGGSLRSSGGSLGSSGGSLGSSSGSLGSSGGSLGSSGGSFREQWWLIGSDTRLRNCSPGFESSNLPSLQWTASP